jgi:hypothetical protein
MEEREGAGVLRGPGLLSVNLGGIPMEVVVSQRWRDLGGILVASLSWAWSGTLAPWAGWVGVLLEVAVRIWCRIAASSEILV